MTDDPSRLRIAALLLPPLQDRLLAAVEHLAGAIVCLLPGPPSLSLLPDTLSLVVVDPMSGGPALVARLRQFLICGSPWPLLVYTTMTSESAGLVAALGRQGLRNVVFTPYEDTPERFAWTLRRVATTHETHPRGCRA